MQNQLIPNIIRHWINENQNLESGWFRLYLYKMNQELDDEDESESIYLNMSVTNFTVTEIDYNKDLDSSGILLVESIQQLKYYFAGIKFNAIFNTNVDFGGLV